MSTHPREPLVPAPEVGALLRVLVVLAVAAAVLVASGGMWPAYADGGEAGVDDLDQVITNIRNFLTGLLVALATLFLTIGGIRYMLAGSDPSEVGRARNTIRYAALGYGIAVLAPLLIEILRGFVDVG